MSNSGQKINYALRPAKSVERKMMCELFRKTDSIYKINKYRYIGFGSFYFSDFTLLHNSLGISKMCSIEIDTSNKERYEFNRPYKCIEMHFGDASNVLSSEINWNGEEKNIIWLDYDGVINGKMLNDLELCVKKVSSCSYVSISFSCKIDGANYEQQQKVTERLPYLMKNIGNYLKLDLKEKDITAKNIHNILWNAIKTSAEKAIDERNTLFENGEKFYAQPVMFFKYKDGVEMMTITFLIAQEKDRELVKKCALDELDWYKDGNECYSIESPNLTFLELRTINKYLPGASVDELENIVKFIKKKDLENYIKIYKYYPNYLENQTII